MATLRWRLVWVLLWLVILAAIPVSVVSRRHMEPPSKPGMSRHNSGRAAAVHPRPGDEESAPREALKPLSLDQPPPPPLGVEPPFPALGRGSRPPATAGVAASLGLQPPPDTVPPPRPPSLDSPAPTVTLPLPLFTLPLPSLGLRLPFFDPPLPAPSLPRLHATQTSPPGTDASQGGPDSTSMTPPQISLVLLTHSRDDVGFQRLPGLLSSLIKFFPQSLVHTLFVVVPDYDRTTFSDEDYPVLRSCRKVFRVKVLTDTDLCSASRSFFDQHLPRAEHPGRGGRCVGCGVWLISGTSPSPPLRDQRPCQSSSFPRSMEFGGSFFWGVYADQVFSVIWGWGWYVRDTGCCPATHFHPFLSFEGGDGGIT